MKLIIRALLFGLAVVSVAAFADTGALKVTVTDKNGSPLTGITVEAETPESLTKRKIVTDEKGEARLIGLDPSHKYEVTITGEGYQTLKSNNVVVISGQSFSLEYSLNPMSQVTEEVFVTGERTALVDTTSAMVGQDITLDLTESLPTGRSYQDYLQLAPGTKPSLGGNPSSKSGVNYSDAVDADGNTSGASTDNVYYIDGVDVTDNYSGTFGSNLNSEIIQEQHVLTGGIPAEYRGSAGLISRVVTKSGSNEFHGSVNYYFQNDSLVADNKHIEGNSFSTFDTAFTLGGPIVKDKLWFFTSYQIKNREDDVFDKETKEKLRTVSTDQDLAFVKLTYKPTDADKITALFFNDPYERNGSTDSTISNLRDRTRNQGGDNFKLSYSHDWEAVNLTVDYFRHEAEISSYASNGSTRNDVAFLDYDPTNAEQNIGGYGQDLEEFRNKDSLSVTVDYFLDTDFGDHAFKAGYTTSTAERKLDLVYSGDGSQYSSIGAVNSGTTMAEYLGTGWNGPREIVSDDYARILEAMDNSPNSAYYLDLLDTDSSGDISNSELDALVFNSSEGNPEDQINVYRINMTQTAPVTYEVDGQEFFIQDQWSLNAWTFNLGLRAEKWEHKATDGSTIFTFDWEVAPRLSVVYDIDGDSKVWAYSGRYYDPIRTDMTSFAGTLTGPVREEQIRIGDYWETYRIRGGSQAQDAFFAPSTKTPYTDEILIGYSRLLTDEISGEVTYSNRKTKDLLEDYDLGLYTDPNAAGDFALPLSYFGYSEIPDSNYVIATLAGGERTYEGLEFTLRRRKVDNWQLLASYTYNQAEGNSNSDGNADFQGDVVWLDPRAPGMSGDQPGNIEHLFKVVGSYSFDFGLEIGARYIWNSGLVYSETWSVSGRHLPERVDTPYEYGGVTTAWVDEGSVGSHTSESYGTLDLRAKYTKEFGKYTAEFFLDIFNALDDQAVAREQDLLAGDSDYAFGEGVDWVEPRRFYLGARLSF
ncbi:hypothetical protein TDB9533_01491 [Thalassocella blandensis]|nr:hypothetical protein TDB9533_01491 [Thalassocella blandensis]